MGPPEKLIFIGYVQTLYLKKKKNITDEPYPNSGGITSFLFSPSHILLIKFLWKIHMELYTSLIATYPINPWSHPLMTCPDPNVNVNGWPRGMLLSNSVPSSSVPYKVKY